MSRKMETLEKTNKRIRDREKNQRKHDREREGG